MKTRHIIFLCLVTIVMFGILSLHFFPETIYRHSQHIAELFNNVNHWEDDDRPTLVYIKPPSHWLGETESMMSLLIAARKMGWNLISAKAADNLPNEKLKNAFGVALYNPITLAYNPNYFELFPDIPIILINNFAKEADIANRDYHMNKLMNMQGFNNDPRIIGLLTVTASEFYQEFNPTLKSVINESHRKNGFNKNNEFNNSMFFPNLGFMMNWYLTLAATYYQPQLNKLMYCGARWPDVRSLSQKYLNLWKKLDNSGYFAVYGDNSWDEYKSYKGYIPANGKSFVKEINKNGICLVMHSEIHLKEGIPSGRIFEAAAAAAVIISDKHPFVVREFKDSVLYVDETRDDLYEQIDAHMKWIVANPAKAKEKARLSHAIFLQKFTQEQQLAKLYGALQKARKKEF